MSTFEIISEYNLIEDWPSYRERLEFYFETNEVDNSKIKRAILLSIVGSETYKPIRGLLAPKTPKDTNFTDIVKALNYHHIAI